MRETQQDGKALEKKIGYAFNRPDLLRLALTHPSARTELNLSDDNQRLEFVGDAVLGLLAAEYGYREFKDMDEGDLTELRTSCTRTGALADISRACDLGAHLIFGRGEESGGGAGKPRNLANAMEALIGAVYLDGGLAGAKSVFDQLFIPLLSARTITGKDNPKGILQERVQKRGLPLPEYTVTSEEGPSHRRHFTIKVRVGSDLEATGEGHSKREAEAAAAAGLLKKLA